MGKMNIEPDTFTENGSPAYSSTLSSVLDLYGNINAMRAASEAELIKLFSRALNEDPLLTMKTLFWSRDVRGGQGERRAFRVLLKYLANNKPEFLAKNMHLIPEYGRYDDLFSLFNTPLEEEALKLIKLQVDYDLANSDK